MTPRGADFAPVLVALLDWGNRHYAPEGASMLIVDGRTGQPAEPMLVDKRTGRPLQSPAYRLAAGPAATAGTLRRLERGSRLLDPLPAAGAES